MRPVLPEPLLPLSELVRNLRWSWHPGTRELFRCADPEGWQRSRNDPQRMLASVPVARLNSLAEDRGFLRRLEVAVGDLRDYLTEPRWYQQQSDQGSELPAAVAYFSPEFGITTSLPQYSGGLGILAGDHLKAASDLGAPLIGVGLLYRHGYFSQSLSRDGWQQERYPVLDPDELPLELLREKNGTAVEVRVALPGGRSLRAQVWVARVGRVPLLLLDSDVEENGDTERAVTDRLYGGGREQRLLQEMLLGIGGVRAVRAYCRLTGHAAPEVFHTNEGHAGFLGLERIQELIAQGGEFTAALEAVRGGTVFTTHTPVPAGIDRFEPELIDRHFGDDGELPAISAEQVLELGVEHDSEVDQGMFNMAVMGLRLAQRANGVSTLHGSVSRQMFAGLWPGFDAAEVPITSITNGVHAPTWVAPEIAAHTGRLADSQLWEVRRTLREQLVQDVRARLYRSWRARGAADAELGWIDNVLDPDVLTVGFARRVPSYKRLTLMLHDRDRLMELLLHPERPVQLVIAGKAHPADDGGKRLIQELVRFTDDPRVRHRIVFLPDYSMGMAQKLYPGCDVWLNNPLRPLEACGTSGMKAALNGCLNLSVLDGWWDEWYDPDFGWAIPSAEGSAAGDDRRDAIEAGALYDMLEDQVAPCFYERPYRWLEMIRATVDRLGPRLLADRMVREYIEGLYTPAARSHRELDERAAAELARWKASVRAQWSQVSVGHVEAQGPDGDSLELGAALTLRVQVTLGELEPGDVEVQAVAGRVDDTDTLNDPVHVSLKQVAGPDLRGQWTFEGPLSLDRTGPFGYTVRVLPAHRLLAYGAELGLAVAPSPPPVTDSAAGTRGVGREADADGVDGGGDAEGVGDAHGADPAADALAP